MSNRHNLIENCFTLTKIEIDLDMYYVNLYTKCHNNMSYVCDETVRKLQIFLFFPTSKVHNSVEMTRAYQ